MTSKDMDVITSEIERLSMMSAKGSDISPQIWTKIEISSRQEKNMRAHVAYVPILFIYVFNNDV